MIVGGEVTPQVSFRDVVVDLFVTCRSDSFSAEMARQGASQSNRLDAEVPTVVVVLVVVIVVVVAAVVVVVVVVVVIIVVQLVSLFCPPELVSNPFPSPGKKK